MVSAAGLFTALFLLSVVAFTVWIVRVSSREGAGDPEQFGADAEAAPENGGG